MTNKLDAEMIRKAEWDEMFLTVKRRLRRAPDLIGSIFEEKKPGDLLRGDECMQLMNTYGLPIDGILFMAYSHGLIPDCESFRDLMIEQWKINKGRQPLLGTDT